MAVKLTEGAISLISTGEWKSTDPKPVLQVLDIRNIQKQNLSGVGNNERYRIELSDGSFHHHGMLGTQLNELARSQELQKGSIVQVNEYVCSQVHGRMLVIIVNLDVIIQYCDSIGNPTPWSHRFGSGPPTSAPMQSINQPLTTTGSPQMVTGSVTRPNFPANSPIYPPQQGHNAGLHYYSNSTSNFTNTRPPANSYTHPVAQPTYNQPPSMYNMNRGPTVKTEAQPNIVPISALNPYQGRWTVKARVTAKTQLRHYNNAKGDGKVFSFDLLDSHGGEIRATCFNDVADQFYDQVQVFKVYLISKGSLKPKQKTFNHLNSEYEITLDKTSTIQPCLDDDKSIPQQQYHFRQIAEIEGLDNNAILDIIGVVYSITPPISENKTKVQQSEEPHTSLKNLSKHDMLIRFDEVTNKIKNMANYHLKSSIPKLTN